MAQVRVVTGTGYETLALLYRHIQAEHGLPGLGPDWSGVDLPAGLHPAADWFFRGDIALGMNLLPLALDHGWHTPAELATGLAALDPAELAALLLRSPDSAAAEHRKRDREIAEVLSGKASREPLLAALHGERFDTSAAQALLEDPAHAAAELGRLLTGYGDVVAGPDLRGPLERAAAEARALLAELPLAEVAHRLFPQNRFERLSTVDSVTLIPSLALAPFLASRFTPPRTALILYPVRPAGQSPSTGAVAALKALAHPQRLEMMRLIRQAPITGHALARATGLTEATVHHHTSLLRTAGLITSTREVNRVYLAAVPGALDGLFEQLRQITGG